MFVLIQIFRTWSTNRTKTTMRIDFCNFDIFDNYKKMIGSISLPIISGRILA
ncbi:hypothetical protein AQPE_2176 [Aquipluma nitroreducens]|uniref:Uncharacterized protein n=1 Tax=Aquipluma nitroreducens TaxID=2010828 RepID=A0A5K7S906_9BACT|nr:hypothetical protein AQPE_2176 [Aquipluma nitroreducens]